MGYNEGKIKRKEYYEVQVDNDTEKKFRVFVEKRYVEEKYYDCGWYPVDREYYYEISSGENVISHYNHEFDDECKLYIPYDAINSSFYKFYRIYSLSTITDADFEEWASITPHTFEKIMSDTKKGIPRWRGFFSFDEWKKKEVSAIAISDYLKELKEEGKEKEYIEYVKNLVLDLQRKYIEVLSSYYKRAEELCKKEQIQKEKIEQSKSYISSFSKKIK